MTEPRNYLKQLLQIFWTFFRIGPITFGGGYAMIPVFEREVVVRRRWVNEEEIADVLAVSQTIPGAVALNSASMVGFRLAGVPGAVAAMTGILLPTFLIVIGLGALLFFNHDQVKLMAAMEGIRPAIVALIVFAGYRVFLASVTDRTSLILMLATAFLLVFQWSAPILVILAGGAVGVAISYVRNRLGYRNKPKKGDKSVTRDPDYFIGEGI